MEKTDLKKILSVAGEHGLFEYVAQGRNGMIAESLVTKQRKMFGPSAKVSSLADISIYTTSEELSLKAVFEAMAKVLSGAQAMDSKSDSAKIKQFFDEIVPNYDEDRFYVSHMKKILDWYNCLQKFASLEFVEDEEEKADNTEESKAE